MHYIRNKVRYMVVIFLLATMSSANVTACNLLKDCHKEAWDVVEQIADEGERVGEQIDDESKRVVEQIVDESKRVVEQIVDEGKRVVQQIDDESDRTIDRMTYTEFRKWQKETRRIERQAKEESKRAAEDAEDAVREAARQANDTAKKLKNEARRIAKQIEDEVKRTADRIQEIERAANKVYRVTIVDPGIEKFISDANEDIFEPIWPAIGQAFKSLCHNWCEIAEGQRHRDGNSDPSGLRSDGVNQSYNKCMSCGCSLGFSSDQDGSTSPCFGGCKSNERYDACYVYTENEEISPKQKLINDLANSLELFREVTGIDNISNIESTSIELNLPTAVQNVFEKRVYASSSKNNDVLSVYEPIDFLDRLKAPDLNSDSIDAITWGEIWSKYTTVETFREDQIAVRDELRNQNIDMASLGLYVVGTAKLTADIAALAIDIGSGTGRLSAPIRSVVVERVLSITNEAVGSQSSDEFAMKILVKNMGPAGMFAVNTVNIAQDVHMLMVEFPELVNTSTKAKRENIQRTSKAIFRANKNLKSWENIIRIKALRDGIQNPLELPSPESYLIEPGEKHILLPKR